MWGSINCGPRERWHGIARDFCLVTPVRLALLSFLSLQFSAHGTLLSNVTVAAGGSRGLFPAARIAAASAGRGQLARSVYLLSAWTRQPGFKRL